MGYILLSILLRLLNNRSVGLGESVMVLNSVEREFLSRLSFEPWTSPPVFDHGLLKRLVANNYVTVAPRSGGVHYEITDLGRAAIVVVS